MGRRVGWAPPFCFVVFDSPFDEHVLMVPEVVNLG
jgi:hypothetical protein